MLRRHALVLVVAATACGAARPSFERGVYRSGQASFRVAELPATWTRLDVGHGLAFRDDAHDASVLLNARCGEKDDDVPLEALTNHLVAGTTDRRIELEETVPFDGREARHTRMLAKLDGVARSYDLFVLKKDGCVYDLVYVAGPSRAQDGTAEFERFASSFRALGAP